MVKILYISGIRPIGGIKSFILNYQSHFNRDVLNIDHLYFSDNSPNDFDHIAMELGSKVYQFPGMKYSRFLSIYRMLDEFFSEHAHEYLAIHIHSPNVAFICGPLAMKYGIKYSIMHSHSIKFSGKLINSLRNRLLCFNLKCYSNVYLACSKIAAEFLYGKKYCLEGKVKIFKNAIDCDRFKFNVKVRNKLRENMNLADKLVIGHVGNFYCQKNHEFLLYIFQEMIKIRSDVVLMLVGENGDDNHIDFIKRKVKFLGLENNVLFLGKRMNVNDLMSAMDIFVLPSHFEGLGMVLIEAQASGLPCFASDMVPKEAGITDLVHYIALNKSASIWAKEIFSHIDGFVRKDHLQQICDAGYEIKIEAKKLEDFYLSLQ